MMANPRRNSLANTNNNQSSIFVNQTSTPTHANSASSRIIHFLKKPHAFPFLLSVFLFLTWLSLKLQHTNSRFSPPTLARAQQTSNHHDHEDDAKAGLVRFPSGFPSPLAKDTRGWMLDPISLALTHHLSGGAVTCASLHLGEIRPGALRGNHRHHTCNETLVIWGAKTKYRLENSQVVGKGYAEVIIDADEVAVAASPSGTAHALVNVDPIRSSYFIGCQDSIKKPSGLSWNYAAACEKLEDIHEACRGGVVQSLHCKTIHVPNFAVQYQRICGISSCCLSNLFKPILLIEH